MKKILALVFICLVIGIPMTYAILSTEIKIPGEGRTTSSEIVQLTYSPQKIDWGDNITYAVPITREVTITNTGNVYTILHMTATFKGVPTTQVTWNKENTILAPNESTTAKITFTLTVNQNSL
jgi:hypothetical protein